jgi:hypothetical protein
VRYGNQFSTLAGYTGIVRPRPFSPKEIAMKQSEQDDHFDSLQTFAECVYFNLVLASLRRTLTDDEAHILQRASDVAGQLHPQALGTHHFLGQLRPPG